MPLSDRCSHWLRKLQKAPFVVLAFFLLLSCLSAKPRLLELTTHFKLQYFGGALFFTALYALIRAWRWMAAAALCTIISGASLVDFYVKPANALSGRTEKHLRLMQANVLYSNDNYQSLLVQVQREQPDLLFLQEYTPAWERNTQSLRAAYPHGIVDTRGNVGGNAALSHWPLTTTQMIDAGNYLSPTLEVNLAVGSQTLTVLTAHPHIPSQEAFPYRNLQLQKMGEHFSQITGPKILIGDLNTTMWSPYFHDLLQQSGLRDGRIGFGILATWPQCGWSPLLRIPLDHCLVSPQVRVENFRQGADIGSDHLPVIVDIAIAE